LAACDRIYGGEVGFPEVAKRVKWIQRRAECPRCEGRALRRSRRRGWVERLLHQMFDVEPYHCHNCRHRFLRVRLPEVPERTQPEGQGSAAE
jgi:hypothetical protein